MYSFKTKLFFLSLLLSFLLTPNLFAQNLGGVVTSNHCGTTLHREGITISIDFPGPYSGDTETYADGSWSYALQSSDPAGLYKITVQGAGSVPSQYTIYKGDPNNLQMDFLIDYEISAPITIDECAGSFSEQATLSPDFYQTIVDCNPAPDGTANFLTFYWNLMEEFGDDIDSSGWPAAVDFPGCARYVLYEATPSGFVQIAANEWRKCIDPIRDCQLDFDFTWSVPPGIINPGNYKIELLAGCCSGSSCKVKRTPTLNIIRQEGYFTYVTPPSQTDVTFDYLTSSVPDAASGTDSTTDGLEPFAPTGPGPALGDVTCGVDAQITGGTQVSEMVYTIREVTCGTSDANGPVIYEETVPLQSGQVPENFFFSEFESDVPSPIGGFFNYFELPENRGSDNCYAITVTAINDCGSFSETGFFTIVDESVCTGCYTQDDSQSAVAEADDRNANLDAKVTDLSVYPNPVNNYLQLEYPINYGEGNVQISTADGAVVLTRKLNITGFSALDFSKFTAGIYYVTVATDTERLVSRFVKL